jgi:hypothetical protein
MGYKNFYYDLTKFNSGNTTLLQPPHGKIWKIVEIYGVITGTSSTTITLKLVKKFTFGTNQSFSIISVSTSSTTTTMSFYIGGFSPPLNSILITYKDITLTELNNFFVYLSNVPSAPSFLYILVKEEDA